MKQFSNGSEVVNLIVSSGILKKSWNTIEELYKTKSNEQSSSPVRFQQFPDSKPTIIAFVTNHVQENEDLVLSSDSESTLKETFLCFKSLCSKNSYLGINKNAITLFSSLHKELSELKSKINLSAPLIITGHSHGGSIASLFTLWLLENIDSSKTKLRPLCITFGSPLLGDIGFQKAIYQNPIWNSCFLHLLSKQQPLLPKPASQENTYKPFGRVILCSKTGSTCLENPDIILELLNKNTSNNLNWETLSVDHYKEIVEHLTSEAICKETTEPADWITNSFKAGIFLQLSKTGGVMQTQNEDMKALIAKIESQEKKFLLGKKKVFNQSKRLNDSKKFMACFEWYKKVSKDMDTGYYDSYKNMYKWSESDIKVEEYKKRLENYWIDEVEEAKRNPFMEGVPLRTSAIHAGHNYRRMVEPLEIADYYNKGLRNYRCEGRSEHFILLEKWMKFYQQSSSKVPNLTKKQEDVATLLTEDSCFWAEVEEALILCNTLLKNEGLDSEERKISMKKLGEFENYVFNLLKDYAVSPEIFLKYSTFMKWWKDYKKIVGDDYFSPLIEFMNNKDYIKYGTGKWNPNYISL